MNSRPDLIQILNSDRRKVKPVIDPRTGMPHIPDWEIERRKREERRRGADYGEPLYLPTQERPYTPDDTTIIIPPPGDDEDDDKGYGTVIKIL